jgi:hypothetical protein
MDSSVQLRRWQRYGNDRLYMTLPDGTQVGFWDVAAQEAHPAAPEYSRVLIDAAVDWMADQLRSGRAAPAKAPPAVQQPAAADPAGPASVGVLEPGARIEPEAPAAGSASAGRTAPAASGAPAPADPGLRPWRDLAANDAGAQARQQARAARAAAPIRTTVARLLGVHTEERAWRIGADGEQKVAAQLDRLAQRDPRWRFLHAVPVGDRGADIDHLVIGPGGVFTVNAKHHPGAKIWVGGRTFLVNGVEQPYLRNSRHEAGRAARLLGSATGLDVHVDGLVVPVNARDLVVKSTPEGTHVVPRMQVAGWLHNHGDVLSAASVQLLYQAARRSTTWTS